MKRHGPQPFTCSRHMLDEALAGTTGMQLDERPLTVQRPADLDGLGELAVHPLDRTCGRTNVRSRADGEHATLPERRSRI